MTSMSLAATAPPPALVVIGSALAHEGSTGSATARPATDPLLVGALPAARRALVLGDAEGRLTAACAMARPATEWHRDEMASPADVSNDFDLFVVAEEWLARSDEPRQELRALHARATPGAQLFAALRNQATLSLLQRWLEADLSDVDDGPLTGRHLRYASPASFYKLLLDTGWLPSQAAEEPAPAADPAFAAAAVALAGTVGVPAATAQRWLGTGRLVVRATRDAPLPAEPAGAARFDVIVPATRETQLRLNVEQSPGLAEVDARVVSYRRASSAADAFEQALPHTRADWILFAHQDIYFPEGFGRRLNALLASIADDEAPRTLIGFAGMGVDAQQQGYEPRGFVIDRRHRFDHPESTSAVSLDELAIVVSRRSLHRIDPALGWHLWATDLCLSAIRTHRCFARIVRMPLFHNSSNDHRLPASFHASASVLAAKHPEFGAIATLCGTIDAGFLAAHRSPVA